MSTNTIILIVSIVIALMLPGCLAILGDYKVVDNTSDAGDGGSDADGE